MRIVLGIVFTLTSVSAWAWQETTHRQIVSDALTALSFLALPVIPRLRLTDLGLVDVDTFEIVPLFVDDDNPE